jgi:hypothetical protein
MSKFEVQMKFKAHMIKFNKKENALTLSHFDIHLASARLPVGRDFEFELLRQLGVLVDYLSSICPIRRTGER